MTLIGRIDSKPDDAEAGEKHFVAPWNSIRQPTSFTLSLEISTLKRGSREECVRSYSEALKYAPEDPTIRSLFQKQIQLVSHEALVAVNPLRDPHLE